MSSSAVYGIGHLGQCDTDRIVSIYVATPKVAKASKAVGKILLAKSANINDLLDFYC